jgi:hypothetical protein
MRGIMGYTDIEKKRKYQLEWMRKRRTAWFRENGPCSKCGTWNMDRLRLHHVDKNDKVDHKVWSWSKKRRECELAKCVVLCLDCHADLHGLETPVPEHVQFSVIKAGVLRVDVTSARMQIGYMRPKGEGC